MILYDVSCMLENVICFLLCYFWEFLIFFTSKIQDFLCGLSDSVFVVLPGFKCVVLDLHRSVEKLTVTHLNPESDK